MPIHPSILGDDAPRSKKKGRSNGDRTRDSRAFGATGAAYQPLPTGNHIGGTNPDGSVNLVDIEAPGVHLRANVPASICDSCNGCFRNANRIFLLFFMTCWIASDAVEIYYIVHPVDEHNDHNNWNDYMTNWFWTFSMCVRGILLFRIVYFFMSDCIDSMVMSLLGTLRGEKVPMNPEEHKRIMKRVDNFLGCMWSAVGTSQFAILITFFALTQMESSVVLYLLAKPGPNYSCAQVILGNHLRHVTPVILHFGVTVCCRKWYSKAVLNAEFTAPIWRAWFGAIVVPITLALIYMSTHSFDPRNVYNYGETETTVYIIVLFSGTVFLSSFYYLLSLAAIKDSLVL